MTEQQKRLILTFSDAMDKLESFCVENKINCLVDLMETLERSESSEHQEWLRRIETSGSFLRGAKARISAAKRCIKRQTKIKE